MSTIVDHQIEHLVSLRKLIAPYNQSQLNPASYDVQLGKSILVESVSGDWVKHELPYDLEPGEFVLGATKEFISIPPNIEAQFQLKSSRGREGYEHVLSGYIDPGFSGQVTLELLNVNRYRKLPLREGMLIGQLRFMKTDDTASVPYNVKGHYNGDKGVQPSKTNIMGAASPAISP